MKIILHIIVCLFVTVYVPNLYAAPDESVTKEKLLRELEKTEKNDTVRLSILFQ